MASQVEICNAALALIGQRPITDIDDESNASAVSCKSLYPIAVDALLERMAWPWAVKRVQLALLSTAPVFGFTYAFQLPADLIRVLAVGVEGEDLDSPELLISETTHKVEGNQVLIEADTCFLKYVYRVTEPGYFSPLFASALAAQLAADLSASLTDGPPNLVASMIQLAEARLRTAMGSAARSGGTTTQDTHSTWVDARR